MLSVVRCEYKASNMLCNMLCNTLMIDASYIADAHPPTVFTALLALTARFMQDSVQQYMCTPLSTMDQVQHYI